METPVIDFHCHAGRNGRFGVNDDPELYLRIMDAAGIDKACINCVQYGDARRANDYVAKFVAKYPDRFIGVAYVTPRYPEEAMTELERCFGELGMKYLKIYPDYFGKPLDDPAYSTIFEWLNNRGLAVMSHAGFPFDEPSVTVSERFTKLSERFPEVVWVLAHEGGNSNPESMEAARLCPNVYLETCGTYSSSRAIEMAVEGAGEDRVLFGSDMPNNDARHQLAKVVTSGITEEAKRKVIGLNAIRLLGLEM